MAGGVLASAGVCTSAFTTQLHQVYITFGVITGIGMGLSYVPCIDVLGLYFDTRFSIACGLAMAGTGAGQFVLSVVTQALEDKYGWRGTLLILSGIFLHLCLAGAVLRPLPVHEPRAIYTAVNNETTSTARALDSVCSSSTADIDTSKVKNEELTEMSDESATRHERNEKSYRRCLAFAKLYCLNIYDLPLFKKPVFVALVIICVGQSLAIATIQVHIVRRARDFHISDAESAYLPAVMGLAQIIGRPLFGTLGNQKKLTPNVPFALALFLVGISMIVSTYTRTLAGQLVFVAIMGACVGGSVVCVAIVVKYFLGSEKLGHALSLLVHLLGICTLLFAPFGGWIRDVSNTYDGTFWMAGVAVLLSSALALVLPLVD
ncbi:monocarboxylate transporter 12-B-like isoform X2 [Ptychodera flava]